MSNNIYYFIKRKIQYIYIYVSIIQIVIQGALSIPAKVEITDVFLDQT